MTHTGVLGLPIVQPMGGDQNQANMQIPIDQSPSYHRYNRLKNLLHAMCLKEDKIVTLEGQHAMVMLRLHLQKLLVVLGIVITHTGHGNKELQGWMILTSK